MVIATLLLFLANTALTHRAGAAAGRGAERVPQFAFLRVAAGPVLGEMLAVGFSVSLFYITYRFASVRRLPRRTALLASVFTAVLFEIAKRLYGLYLANFASFEGPSGDANIGAAGPVHPLDLLHRHRVPAGRRGGRDLGAAEDAAAAAGDCGVRGREGGQAHRREGAEAPGATVLVGNRSWSHSRPPVTTYSLSVLAPVRLCAFAPSYHLPPLPYIPRAPGPKGAGA